MATKQAFWTFHPDKNMEIWSRAEILLPKRTSPTRILDQFQFGVSSRFFQSCIRGWLILCAHFRMNFGFSPAPGYLSHHSRVTLACLRDIYIYVVVGTDVSPPRGDIHTRASIIRQHIF